MKISRAEACEIWVPLRFSLSSSPEDELRPSTVIVRLEDESENCGWGEAIPLAGLTGESTTSILNTIEDDFLPLFSRSFDSFADGITFVNSLLPRLDKNKQSAFCAFELAFLDLLGNAFGKCCSRITGDTVRELEGYSAVLETPDLRMTREFCVLAAQFGINSVKFVSSGSVNQDCERLKVARRILGESCGIRLDARCGWNQEEALENLVLLEAHRLDALEQPLPKDDLAAMAWLTRRTSIPIIADESLISFEDAERLIACKACHIISISISKCGGLCNSLRIRDLARQAGMRCMLGSSVSETAILAAAGRHFASISENLIFLEGSFGQFLLKSDIAEQDLSFGPNGRASALSGHGLGITIDLDKLEPLVLNHRQFL